MVYLPKDVPTNRFREAMRARENRLEIVKAHSTGEVSRRELFKWGIFGVTGAIAYTNGLSPFAPSAFARDIPTGTPRSPMFGAKKFTQPLPRMRTVTPHKLTRNAAGEAEWPAHLGERPSRRLSYHTDFTADPTAPAFRNPITGRGPIEGRPPGELFAHQRWDEFFPQVGYQMTWGQAAPNTRFHPLMPAQHPNSVWTWGQGRFVNGTMPINLIKMRYGEPVIFRAYNGLPVDRHENGGFGRNETQLHFHNAHNGSESDGAANVHHFPGTFYDYRWGTTLARRDKINTQATDRRASGPDGKGGLINVAGDFRELQGTLWAHDHRFFFTAENVYKGNLMYNMLYSGPDRGNESLNDGVNLRLPSGSLLDWGNVDFDVCLAISDAAFKPDGQLFFDIFGTDGFLGDVPLVNFAYAPFMNVLPRKYRIRLAAASMSRFWQFAFVDSAGKAIPVQWIANDGNLFPNPITVTSTDQCASGERYDVVIDFSAFKIGSTIRLVNFLEHADGKGPKGAVPLAQAIAGATRDPCVGPIMEFRVSSEVESVDVPGHIHRVNKATGKAADPSVVPLKLTEQIPIVAPVRTRVVEFGRSGGGTSRGPNGECTPDCEEYMTFPWSVKVNGQSAHTANANRVSLLIPKPGEVEHWTYVNGGNGWDHPIHLHFEEGVTIDRGRGPIGPHEKNKRKDVWRLRETGQVTFQVQFGEFAGSYVNHCHNTVHEDFAMLLRMQLLSGKEGDIHNMVTATPNPTPDGVFYTKPEILPEADPRNPTGTARPKK
jgi:FtsP/CotA-like multicopper oxidase with cupredoxin domain